MDALLTFLRGLFALGGDADESAIHNAASKFVTALKNALGLDKKADTQMVLNSLGELQKKAETGEAAAKRIALFNAAFPDLKDKDGVILQNALSLATKPPGHTDDEFQKLQKRVQNLQATETTALVNGAIEDGRLLPAQKDWALKYALDNRAGFEDYLKNQTPQSPDGELKKGGDGGTLTAEDKAVCNQLDINEADYLKNNKQEAGVN